MEKITRTFDPIWEWILDETPTEDGFLSSCRCAWGGSGRREIEDDDLTLEERFSRTLDGMYVDYIEDPVTRAPPETALSTLQPPQIPDFLAPQKRTWLKRIRSKKAQPVLDMSTLTNALTLDKKKRSFLVRRRA